MDFAAISIRSKRRKVENLRKAVPTPELTLAAEMNLRVQGKKVEAELVKEILHTTPTRASRISKAWGSSNKAFDIQSFTPTEALALMLDTDISRQGYQILRTQSKNKGADIYPSYKKIQDEKKLCYPSSSAIEVSESKAEVKLQALLDHTTQRISKIIEDVSEKTDGNIVKFCTLLSKWGLDGSGSQSTYKQVKHGHDYDDSHLLMTCFVPLQLFCGDGESKEILWHNPTPSSTRYCRPIKLEFVKETYEIIRKEEFHVSDQISKLMPTIIHTTVGEIKVHHKLTLSMVDGKVINSLTGTKSAQKCNVCSAGPAEMNKIDKVMQRKIDVKALELGLSTLHAYLRFMHWLLQVSYKLDTKRYYKTSENKLQIEKRKADIQNQFKKECGLLVDFVKGNFGTTNDGNSARRFFQDPATSSRITGIDKGLIDRCDTILRALSSGYAVNVEAFKHFAIETARLYVKLYEWYPMPASVHKVLIHGSEAIQVAFLPIGMLSEEAQEARNKDFRKFREHKSRKISRTDTMKDVFNMMMITSDPFISTIRTSPRKRKQKMKKAVRYLIDGTPDEEDETDEEEKTDDEEEADKEEETDAE